MNSIQKIGLGIGAGALALGGVAGFAGLAQAADPTTTPAPGATAGTGDAGTTTTTERDERGPGGRHGDMRGQDAAALAEKLGLDETKVSEALQTAHDALRDAHRADDTTTRPTPEERRAELAAELAKALGVDEAKVTEALTALETERNAERPTALQERLDQAVSDGTLTRAEADAVTKAVEAGVIGGGGPGGPGGKGMGRSGR